MSTFRLTLNPFSNWQSQLWVVTVNSKPIFTYLGPIRRGVKAPKLLFTGSWCCLSPCGSMHTTVAQAALLTGGRALAGRHKKSCFNCQVINDLQSIAASGYSLQRENAVTLVSPWTKQFLPLHVVIIRNQPPSLSIDCEGWTNGSRVLVIGKRSGNQSEPRISR